MSKANNPFAGIGYFKGTFSLQVKNDVKSYQVPPKCITYAIQVALKKEEERLQEHQILARHGLDKMAESNNNFSIVPILDGTVHLCLDPQHITKYS